MHGPVDTSTKHYYPAKRIPSLSTAAWTDDRIERLKQLWVGGVSCSHISALLGGVSRNAVIGKIHRLGLSGRHTSAPKVNHFRESRVNKHVVIRPGQKKTYGGEVQVVTDLPLPREPSATDIPIEQRKTLLELTNKSCRFPYGNPASPDFFFCGAPEADLNGHRPYCPAHCRIVYAKPAAPITRAEAELLRRSTAHMRRGKGKAAA